MIARLLLGVIFTVFGLNGFFNFLPVPEMAGDGGKFMGIMIGSGYLYVVKLLEVVGGVLLLANRKTPVALTLLTPVAVNIFLFHAFLENTGLPIGILVLVLSVFLVYQRREKFQGILVG